MIELDINRHNHLVDPSLHIWGWQIPTYLFLGGVTAGLMIVVALLGRRTPAGRQSRAMRWLPFAAPVVLSIGMLALFLDLEKQIHVFRFYTAFRVTSPMSWGAWILLLIYPATLLLGMARLTEAELRRFPVALARMAEWARFRASGLETLNILLGIALGAYTGILLGTLGARALWSSALLGPLFLVSGLSTGAALVMLFPLTHDEHETLRRWDVVAIGVELAVLAMFFVHLATAGERSRAAAALFFGGAWTAAFWSLVVVAGLAVPLAFELLERRVARPSIVAPLLLLAGGFALRWIFVAAGQGSL